MKSIEDAAMMLIYVERERIIDFLAGLNVEYGRIKVQALGKEDLPPLNEVFSIIRAKEGRRKECYAWHSNNRKFSSCHYEAKLHTAKQQLWRKWSVQITSQQRWVMVCLLQKNRGIPRRLVKNYMESCNHLVGGMEIDLHNLDNRNGQAHIAQSKENSQPKTSASDDSNVGRLNREEIERLCSLLTSMDKPTASCFLA